MEGKKPKRFPEMMRVAQITSSHCGPAVVRMLLSFLGHRPKQKEIEIASGVSETIRLYGMNVEQMEIGVENLNLGVTMWSKMHTTVEDLDRLVNEFKYPVGIEWQGVFREYDDGDPGHYSIVTGIDLAANRIWINDPYWAFAWKDRLFRLDGFVKRWWDTNLIKNVESGKETYLLDEKLSFILTGKEETFPQTLGFIRGSVLPK